MSIYDQCWDWLGAKDKDGYGIFRLDGKNVRAHRYIVNFTGPAVVCHRCDNPSCVNPAHLFVGSNTANQQDAAKKGRCRKQKLSIEDVKRIREARLFGASTKDLALLYDVDRSHIQRICTNDKWKHVN